MVHDNNINFTFLLGVIFRKILSFSFMEAFYEAKITYIK